MTTLEDLRNVLSSIVALVGYHDELKGRVRLQKLGYLLQQRGFRPLAKVRFAYYHYGPFSHELVGALDQVVASGLVQENAREFENGRRLYKYQLDPDHPDNEYLALAPADAEVVREFMDITGPAHWRTLELAATVVYLERSLSLPREAAFTRALGLKPDCQLFREHAEKLLEDLELR